ncbi:MAG: hypothetical protein ACREFK_03150, partial [Stellaceae bacterium]
AAVCNSARRENGAGPPERFVAMSIRPWGVTIGSGPPGVETRAVRLAEGGRIPSLLQKFSSLPAEKMSENKNEITDLDLKLPIVTQDL